MPELSSTPLPFLDWSLVEMGKVTWVGERGEEVRPTAGHAYHEGQIRPLSVGVAYGVRIRAQAATRAGLLFPDALPWEVGLRLGSSVMFDEDIYRLWYHSAAGLVYAQSQDGLQWTRQLIDFVPFREHDSTNLMPPLENTGGRKMAFHEGAIFKDPSAAQGERYKAVFTGVVTAEEVRELEAERGMPASLACHLKRKALFGAVSPDGFSWTVLDEPIMLHSSDTQSVVFYDEAAGKYVGYFRLFEMGRRCIARAETEDFRVWPLPTPVLVPGPDDEPYLDYYTNAAAPYPGNPDIQVMLPTVYDQSRDRGEIRLAVSRDGTAWHWVPGGPVLTPGEPGEYDGGTIFSNVGLLRATDGRLACVYTAYNRPYKFPRIPGYTCGLALASWPEDRMAAIVAEERGEFTTVLLRLQGPCLLLNMQAQRAGEIRVEVRDRLFRPIPGRTLADADPLTGDHLTHPVTWGGSADLTPLQGQFIYLRFHLRAAKLFAMKAA